MKAQLLAISQGGLIPGRLRISRGFLGEVEA